MIRNNLAVLLAQKEIKISRMALDTGLSRTTLTALSQNESKRIDNDTLNVILMYLQITPNQFFNFISYDFIVQIETSDFDIERIFSLENDELDTFILKKAVFDLFVTVDDKVSSRSPIYEFEIKIDDKYSKSVIRTIRYEAGYNDWETEDIIENKFVFNIVGKNETLERFNSFVEQEIAQEFQKEIAKKIVLEFKRAFAKAYIDFEPNINTELLKQLVNECIDIVSPSKILGFLPF